MTSELKFYEETTTGGYVKLSLQGEVDIFTSQKLKERLYNIIDTSVKDIVIDCLGLNYIDSTGLGIFVGALKKAKQHDKTIKLVNLKDNIKKLFTITGLDKIFIME